MGAFSCAYLWKLDKQKVVYSEGQIGCVCREKMDSPRKRLDYLFSKIGIKISQLSIFFSLSVIGK